MTWFGDPRYGLCCCICFQGLTPEQCWRDESGQRWDVCDNEVCPPQAWDTYRPLTRVRHDRIRAEYAAEEADAARAERDSAAPDKDRGDPQ